MPRAPATVRQTEVSLSGHVIEDVTYATFRPGRFRAEMRAVPRPPLYKTGGFFVFTNLRSGQYRLRLSAARFNAEEHDVAIPFGAGAFGSPPDDTVRAFSRPGDNELIVVVQSINPATSRVSFVPEVLPAGIAVGAEVRAVGFAARLVERLEEGLIASARLDSTSGLLPGAVLRIIRGRSVRLRFNPYDALPVPPTSHIVGRVALAADPSVGLGDAEVRVLEVNGSPVVVAAVDDALVATMAPGGATTVLGTERDLATRTNDSGDYSLYSVRQLPWTSVLLRVRRSGFLDALVPAALVPAARNRVDVLVTPA